MKFYAEKDLALCGLACVLCSQEDCPGCKARGCKEGSDCSVYQCVTGKGLDGCYQCDEFPCEEKMLQGIRNRAFNQYAKEHGKQTLLDRLRDNFDKGITYHKPDGLKGDYDVMDTEDEIMQLIQFGKKNPYVECPVYDTEHFILRLVTEDDATDLLTCYADTNARPIFNSDTCTSNFFYETFDEICDCVKIWLNSYARKEFVRFSIIDKYSNHAVGTIEMFGMVGKYKTTRGILRLDIASEYEEDGYLNELFSLCLNEFFDLFVVDQIVTKAIPEAVNRVNTLKRLGFVAYDFPEREHYWMSSR
jgi:RimJ/RimL family protein N-acetyltransferase